jgi:hypothetical protein
VPVMFVVCVWVLHKMQEPSLPPSYITPLRLCLLPFALFIPLSSFSVHQTQRGTAAATLYASTCYKLFLVCDKNAAQCFKAEGGRLVVRGALSQDIRLRWNPMNS